MRDPRHARDTLRRSLSALVVLSALACSSEADRRSREPGSGDGGGGTLRNGGSAGAAAALGGSGGTGNSAGNTIDIIEDDGGGPGFVACRGQESRAAPVGLDMYVVLDHSGSMALGPTGQNITGVPTGARLGECPVDVATPPASESRWCFATNALSRFFTAPSERDVRVALQFMTPAQNYDVCGRSADNPHARPAVELQALPVDASSPLVVALDADYPRLGTTEGVTAFQFGTRIESALNGIASFTAANQTPSRKTLGILITDGDPNQCQDSDIEALADIPAAHFQATGIPTFIVGMTGATAQNLENLALRSGSPEHGPAFCAAGHDSCHYWDVGNGEPAAFIGVLEAIREAVTIPCEYALPDAPAGEKLDPALVQVKYTEASGETEEFASVDSAESCDPAEGGWHYDDRGAPRAIVLCAATCARANRSAAGAKLAVAYGCAPRKPR